MEVIQFPKINLEDIPEGLRNLAEVVEKRELNIPGPMVSLVWVGVDEQGMLCAGCLGKNPNRYELAGYLQAAAMKLVRREF